MNVVLAEEDGPVGPPVVIPGCLGGVRSWSLDVDRHGALRLTGRGGSHWNIGGKMTWAKCVPGRHTLQSPHTSGAPAEDCDCGLYAVHPWLAPRDPRVRRRHSLSVLGLIEAWGKIQLYRFGFRAQFARPRALILVGASVSSRYGDLVSRIAEDHHAGLLEFPRLEELVEYCHRRDFGISAETVRSLLRDPDE